MVSYRIGVLGCFEAAGQGLLQCRHDAMERLLYELLTPLHLAHPINKHPILKQPEPPHSRADIDSPTFHKAVETDS